MGRVLRVFPPLSRIRTSSSAKAKSSARISQYAPSFDSPVSSSVRIIKPREPLTASERRTSRMNDRLEQNKRNTQAFYDLMCSSRRLAQRKWFKEYLPLVWDGKSRGEP